MKARLTATLRNAATGAMESITLDVAMSNADSSLYSILTQLAGTLNGYRNYRHWSTQHVGTVVEDCPPGFFPAQQHGKQPLQHEEGA